MDEDIVSVNYTFRACLVCFSASLYWIWRARSTLARMWPCKLCLFGCFALIHPDLESSCLIACLLCSISLRRATLHVWSRPREPGLRETESKSVLGAGVGGAFSMPSARPWWPSSDPNTNLSRSTSAGLAGTNEPNMPLTHSSPCV